MEEDPELFEALRISEIEYNQNVILENQLLLFQMQREEENKKKAIANKVDEAVKFNKKSPFIQMIRYILPDIIGYMISPCYSCKFKGFICNHWVGHDLLEISGLFLSCKQISNFLSDYIKKKVTFFDCDRLSPENFVTSSKICKKTKKYITIDIEGNSGYKRLTFKRQEACYCLSFNWRIFLKSAHSRGFENVVLSLTALTINPGDTNGMKDIRVRQYYT
jgi:hypothetical protein